MRNMVKNLAALLIVLGVATSVATASVDSLLVDSHCKLFSVDNQRQFRLVFVSQSSNPTYVQIFNDDNKLIYKERVESGGFVKDYNLSLIPHGEYRFVVESNSFAHEQLVDLSTKAANRKELELEKAQFVLTGTSDKHYALVGQNNSGATLSYLILDEEGNSILKGFIGNEKEMKKLFNLTQLKEQELTFQFYIAGELVKETLVSL